MAARLKRQKSQRTGPTLIEQDNHCYYEKEDGVGRRRSGLVRPMARTCHDAARAMEQSYSAADAATTPSSLTTSATNIVKPLARRVVPSTVTTTTSTAVEAYYHQSARDQIPLPHVHQAARDTQQAWERVWTSTDADPYATIQQENEAEAAAMAQLSLHVVTDADRYDGAHNPSPPHGSSEEEKEENPRKRTTGERDPPEDHLSTSSPSTLSSDSAKTPQPTSAAHTPCTFHRPVAIRVPQLSAASAALPRPHSPASIPRDIITSQRSLSPMSCSTRQSQWSQRSTSTATTQAPLDTKTPSTATTAAVVIQDDTGLLRLAPDPAVVQRARDGLLEALAVSGGETTSDKFLACLSVLQASFQAAQEAHLEERLQLQHYRWSSSSMSQSLSQSSASGSGQPWKAPAAVGAAATKTTTTNDNSMVWDPSHDEGTWLTLTQATFFGGIGTNDAGDPLYTLGRMSFDIFAPAECVCSLQGNFNIVEQVTDKEGLRIPKSLAEEVGDEATVLRTYNIMTAFTIEPTMPAYPDAPNKDVTRPIRGILTTYGFMIADPTTPRRSSLWITGGKMEPNDDPRDVAAWKVFFTKNPPSHSWGAMARLLAVKFLMGAVLPDGMDPETGAMEYTFTRPLGGHGMAFIDTLYCDNNLRIVRGHRGTFFVFSRMRS